MPDESRRFLRVFRDLPLVLHTSAGREIEGVMLDMSLGGFRFQSRGELEVGEVVTAEIPVSHDRTLRIEGTIVHRNMKDPYHYGISFPYWVQDRLAGLFLENS